MSQGSILIYIYGTPRSRLSNLGAHHVSDCFLSIQIEPCKHRTEIYSQLCNKTIKIQLYKVNSIIKCI